MVYVTHDQTEAMTLGDRVAVMRNGLLQQVGSPQQLYDYPDNLFVAGFIGSPAMNFMPATIDDGTMHTPLGDAPLSGRLRQALEKANAPRDLIIGIRPEAFEDAALVGDDANQNGIAFRATIDVLESMGSDVFVYFTKEIERGVDAAELAELARDSGRADTGASGDTVVARIDTATRIREGDDAELWADLRHLHVFDPSTGLNITGGGGSGPATVTGGAGSPAAASTAAAEPAGAAGRPGARRGRNYGRPGRGGRPGDGRGRARLTSRLARGISLRASSRAGCVFGGYAPAAPSGATPRLRLRGLRPGCAFGG